MADHARIQIRDLVATALKACATGGTNTFTSRPNDFAASELPGRNVLVDDEQSTPTDIHQTILERVMTLSVEHRYAATGDVEKALDTMATETEEAIAGISWPSPNTGIAVLVRTHKEILGQASTPQGYSRLDFDIQYYTSNADPTTLL